MGHPRLRLPELLMPTYTFCDVVVPVPLDAAFTYAILPLQQPVAGGRVVVPFRNEKLIGIVTRLHDNAPSAPGTGGEADGHQADRAGSWIRSQSSPTT